MKTTLSIKLILLVIVMMGFLFDIEAQDTTSVTPVPVTPAPAAAPASAAKPEKEKKDGFNSHTRFGIRAGGVISKTDFESSNPAEDPESKFGGDLAILAAFPIGGGFFTLQPELHWLQKGYKIADVNNGDDIISTLNYLELPLLLRVNFGGSLRVFAFAGPSIGYLLSGEISDGTFTRDAADYLDAIEYSGHLGLGVGLGTFEVDIRYMAGLSDISDTQDLSDVKNSSLGAGLTLKF